MDGSGDDSGDRGLFWWSSGFLVGRTCTIVVTVVYNGTPGSYACEPNGEGGDPGFLTGWTTRIRVILKWCRKFVGIVFGDLFSVCVTTINVCFFNVPLT